MKLLKEDWEKRLYNSSVSYPVSKQELTDMQDELAENVKLENSFQVSQIELVSGVDLAYWSINGKDYAVCCMTTIGRTNKQIVEKKYLSEEILFPYLPNFLSFRELPLILKTYKLLSIAPDIIMSMINADVIQIH